MAPKGNKKYVALTFDEGPSGATKQILQVLKEKGRTDIKLVSSYITPEVEAAVRTGEVLGVVTDFTAAQARVAIDQIVRLLEKKDVQADVDTGFQMIDASNIDTIDRALSLPPEGWEPYFRVE